MEGTLLSILDPNNENKIFNSITNRWIQNTTTNRNRLQKQNENQITSSEKNKKKTMKKLPKIQADDKLTSSNLQKKLSISIQKPISSDKISSTKDGIYLPELCNMYSNPILNLNNVLAKKDLITILDVDEQYIDEVPGIIKYKNKILSVVKYINKGVFGTVFNYSSVDGKYSVAVKTYVNDDDPEIEIIEAINSKDKMSACETVNSKILELYNSKTKKKSKVAVMDLMDGTLKDLIKFKLSSEIILEIIFKLANNLECLNNIGLIYSDLKGPNILYKCFKNNNIKISLGDLGSICAKGEWGTSTYPPPEYTYPQLENNCSESTMVWGLGVVLLELLKINTNEIFAWDNTRSKWIGSYGNKFKDDAKYESREIFDEAVKKEVNNIISLQTDDLIKLLLNRIFLESKRITLQEIIHLSK